MLEKRMVLKADKIERLTERLRFNLASFADLLDLDIRETCDRHAQTDGGAVRR
ncbi:MAG: hypothetical protein LBP26_05210 [Clostridiales bacterium]|nr:hypothetical protein [Clostridiales bacterium]